MDAHRLNRVRESMAAAGLDALFVSNPKNVRYVSGFVAMMCETAQPFNDPEGFVLIQPNGCHLFCDGRYISAARTLAGVTAVLLESPVSAAVIGKTIEGALNGGVRTIGFERNSLLYGDAVGLMEALPKLKWQPAEDLLSRLRIIKTKPELDLLRKAQSITCDAFDHVAREIRVGMTEREVALIIEDYLRKHSEGCSFHSIVAFGETGCNPHYTPSPTRRLEKGQFALLDFGAVHGGYCGDLTRMICMGKADARQREVYDLVLAAQQRCLDAVRPGVTEEMLDAQCRDYFTAKGCGDAFLHGTGHGLGLAIHEEPRLKKTFKTPIEPGMVFTVEPGLYYEDWGGVRIEDVVIATENGCENITKASKKLLEVPVS